MKARWRLSNLARVLDAEVQNLASASSKSFKQLNVTTNPKQRYALMGAAQAVIAQDAVNGYLFQLAKIGIWNSNLSGLWENSPVQANDLTEVSWK